MRELRQEPSLLHFSEEGKACLTSTAPRYAPSDHIKFSVVGGKAVLLYGPHTNTPGGNGSHISFCDVDNARVPANKRRSSHRGLTK